MANNWDKIVKLACKPKSAAPKAKYLDSIIATTYSDDSSLRDVLAALAVRLRDSSNVVIHKALLVLHTMIRMGHTDNVLSFLSSSSNDVLKLRHITNGHNDGNISSYAGYLEARIRVYRDLRHDVIRVQNETNREERISGGDSSRETNGGGVSRSKTVNARKLRHLTVEKGLLRETKGVQLQIHALLQCKFFMDSLEDELNLTTLRLLVKDLLILFQAGNEGVINVLEQYFEMSAVDAEQSLEIYKSFCTQTEGVVEYLSIARKLSNLLNVPVPNLRHAPTKLAGALEEYLRDPNFEQNRIEYKTSKALADGKIKKPKQQSKPETSAEATTSTEASSSKGKARPASIQPTIDLLQSIEESQPTMFNPQTNSPSMTWFQQGQGQGQGQAAAAAAYNPFRQQGVVPQVTGMPAQPFVLPQVTGMVPSASPFAQQAMAPQVTGFPVGLSPFPQANPFPFSQPQNQQIGLQVTAVSPQFQQPTQTTIVQPQPTGFLQPQTTGTNPFRQSILLPQTTGSPFSQGFNQPRSASALTFSVPPLPTQSAASHQPPATNQSPFAAALINRPASTPITSNNGPSLRPVVSHQTGSRNPFGQPKAPSPPPVPKPPTLAELAFGGAGTMQPMQTGIPSMFNLQQQNAQSQQPFSAQLATALGDSGNTSSVGSTNMSSVASAFTLPSSNKPASPPPVPTLVMPTLTAQTTSTTALSDTFSNLSFATSTGTTASSFTPSPLQPQATGLAGLKQFKPTSSFGAALLESMPSSAATSTAPSAVPSPINGLGTTTSPFQSGLPSLGVPTNSNATSGTFGNVGALNSQPTGATLSPFMSSLGGTSPGLNTTPSTGASALNGGLMNGTGSTVGVGLRPQMTGGVNPFRASMAMGGLGGQQPLMSNPTGFNGLSGSSSMGANLFTGANSAFRPTLATIPSFTGAMAGPQQGQAQQPQQSASLI
ncbi:hypothetical protein FRC19_002301 [Serendipita sp. 401]|nr:hypothetical protein FRC19_002301 [Serendipita sp. 401]KAG9056197.1 hypothetical protein FS842_011427 [Serendipita sp. 407]